jgi:DNA-binding NarL/FixJ family response regulator
VSTIVGLVFGRPGVVREGLHAVLSSIPGVVAEEPVDSLDAARETAATRSSAVVILDGSLGQEAMRESLSVLRHRENTVLCIAVASSKRDRRALAELGADAVLSEGASAMLLAETIKKLLARLTGPGATSAGS